MADRFSFKIVVKKVEQPISQDPKKELEWICQSLGFFEPIDRKKTASTVFKEILRAAKQGKPLNSTQLSEKIGMSRGAVINHLNNLMSSGLVVRHGREYYPRSRLVYRMIEEIEEDIERVFTKMKKTARKIDDEVSTD